MKSLIIFLLVVLYIMIGIALIVREMQFYENQTQNDLGASAFVIALIGSVIWLPWLMVYGIVQVYFIIRNKFKKK